MVDYKVFEQDPSSDRRNELMRNVSTLFAIASENCTHEQIDIYDSVLSRLADMVEIEARAYAARKIAPLRRAPQGIVRRLAEDDIEVARPLLIQSPALTDADLIAIAARHSVGHLDAIAERPVLSDRVTDAIIGRGDRGVSRKVAANPGALISDSAFQRLSEQAMNDTEMAAALGARADTPDAIIDDLVAHAADEVRRVLADRGKTGAEADIASATRLAAERMSNGYWLGLYDFETAYARLDGLGGTSIASEDLMAQFAFDDRFPDVVAVFALLAGVSLDEAKHWLVRTDLEPFLVVSRALGLRHATVQVLLRTGPWRHRLTPNARVEALNAFQDIDMREARRSLLHLRQGHIGS
jgi:hypothetical protein